MHCAYKQMDVTELFEIKQRKKQKYLYSYSYCRNINFIDQKMNPLIKMAIIENENTY